MSSTYNAAKSLRYAQRLALANARDKSLPPEWMTHEQQDAWWIVHEAVRQNRRKEAMAALMAWGYQEEERLSKVNP